MATILQTLTGATLYPLPGRTLAGIAARRGIELSDEAAESVIKGSAYSLALADVLMWLSLAPDVTQGGQSYSFTDEQRQQLRNRANALYGKYGGDSDGASSAAVYGYKGSRL